MITALVCVSVFIFVLIAVDCFITSYRIEKSDLLERYSICLICLLRIVCYLFLWLRAIDLIALLNRAGF